MQLAKFIKPIDYRVVLANLCQMMYLFCAIMVLPLVVSVVVREFQYSLLFAGMAIVLFLLGNLGRLFDSSEALEIKEALAVTALSYLMFAFLGGVVFTPEISYVDGLFEAMSGFTTTGLTVVNVGELPASLLFFRSYSQWIGGAGIVVLSLAMLLGPGKSAFKLYTSEFGEKNLAGDVKATAKVGLTAGITSAALPVWTKLLLTFEMWAGRLEILPALVVLYPRLWERGGAAV